MMLVIPILLFTCTKLIGSAQGYQPPHLINSKECLSQCNFKGGYCGGFCGQMGYCCRKGWGDCLQSLEAVATDSHHSCVHGIEKSPIHEEAKAFEKCKVVILPGKHAIKGSSIFGTLDILQVQYSLTFDVRPMVTSTMQTQYLLVLYSKDKRGHGGKFVIFGSNGRYNLKFCGTMAGIQDGCYAFGESYNAGDWIRIHIHQLKDKYDFAIQKTYINNHLVRTVANQYPEVLKKVGVVGVVLPKLSNSGVIGDISIGACGSKFDPSEKSA